MTEYYIHPYDVNIVDTFKQWLDSREDFKDSEAYRLQLADQQDLVLTLARKHNVNVDQDFEEPMTPDCSIEYCFALGRQLLVTPLKNVERILEWQLKRTPTTNRLQLIRWIDSHTNAFMNAHAVSPEHRANLCATETWLNTQLKELLANHPNPAKSFSQESEKYSLISLLEKKSLRSYPEPVKIEQLLETAFKSSGKKAINASHYKQLTLLLRGEITPHELSPMTTTLTKNELLILSHALWRYCYCNSNADRSAKLNASETAAIFKLLFPDTINSIKFSNLAKMAKRRYTEAKDYAREHHIGKSSRVSDRIIALCEWNKPAEKTEE